MPKAYRFDSFRFVDAFQKEITYFLTVSETLNISKAAESLGIQQSGLSRAIHRLESDLGQKLFIRKSNGLALSDAGLRFFASVKEIKQRWEESFRELLASSEAPMGLVKIGLHPSFGQHYFPGILSSLSGKFPRIEIEIHSLPSFQVTRKILAGELDFGIVASALKQPEIVAKVVGKDHLAAFRTSSSAPLTHVLVNPETQMANQVLRKYSKLKKVVVKDYELIAKAALVSGHLAVIPFSVARGYPELRQVSDSLAKANLSLICHKDKLRSKAYRKIYDEILAVPLP